MVLEVLNQDQVVPLLWWNKTACFMNLKAEKGKRLGSHKLPLRVCPQWAKDLPPTPHLKGPSIFHPVDQAFNTWTFGG
jgi:hypothetical protein